MRRIGENAILNCESASCSGKLNWVWRPSQYNGWGFDCVERDVENKCKWTWTKGTSKQWDSWRTLAQLDNVKATAEQELSIYNVNLKDNRIYGLQSPVTGQVVKSFQVKVGEGPSFPSDIECVTHLDLMRMTCEWELGENALLPWARTTSSLRYNKRVLDELDPNEEHILEFGDNDQVDPCPNPCSGIGSRGCCEFDLKLADIDRSRPVTYRIEVISTNLFGSAKMEKMNSKIMHVTPSELIKPLPPVIKEIQSPNEYDGKRLTVFIEHTNHTLSIQEPTYEQKAEYRLKGKRLITVVAAQSELSLFWFLFWSNVLLFHFPLWLHFIKFVKF